MEMFTSNGEVAAAEAGASLSLITLLHLLLLSMTSQVYAGKVSSELFSGFTVLLCN